MQFVPWRRVTDWECLACGICCKLYSVVINFPEWLRISRIYGAEKTIPGIDRLYINRRTDGSCVFLSNFGNAHCCGLQFMKPKACQIWPFKVLDRPQYGLGREAVYPYGSRMLYIYADSMCSGVKYGTPSSGFLNQTLREFVEIALNVRREQVKTTSKMYSLLGF